MPWIDTLQKRKIYLAGMVLILLLAAGLRLYALAADPPVHLSLSQGLNTDGPTTIMAGRNKVLFGAWEPFGGPNRVYYLFPAMSWLGWGVFGLLGVGFWQANFISVLMGLLSVGLLAAFARREFGPRVALLTALFMATDYAYLMYNRVPMVYTTAACGMALVLYCWSRGRRGHGGWFLLAGLGAGFNVLFVKLVGVAVIPAVGLGLLLLAWRRWRGGQAGVSSPVVLFGLGAAVAVGLWWLLIYLPETQFISNHYTAIVPTRTFNPVYGLVENIRFAVQSLLQFGIYSGFFVRLLPLVGLAYGYLFLRAGQWLAGDRRDWPLGEWVALGFLAGTALMLLASSHRPTRYLILLVPPMSLAAGLALEAWLQADRLALPRRFGRLYPLLIQAGLTYGVYQLLAAGVKLYNVAELGTGLGDYRAIGSVRTSYVLLGLALLPGIGGTFWLLWRVMEARRPDVRLPSPARRRRLALLAVVVVVGYSLVQYGAWAVAPRFSLLEASRQVGRELGPETVLGGAYAPTLALENEFPAILFYGINGRSPVVRRAVQQVGLTHLAVESDSAWIPGPFNDDWMGQYFPEMMERAVPVQSFELRGYRVIVYRLGPQAGDAK